MESCILTQTQGFPPHLLFGRCLRSPRSGLSPILRVPGHFGSFVLSFLFLRLFCIRSPHLLSSGTDTEHLASPPPAFFQALRCRALLLSVPRTLPLPEVPPAHYPSPESPNKNRLFLPAKSGRKSLLQEFCPKSAFRFPSQTDPPQISGSDRWLS